MAAGLTDHRWAMHEPLSHPIPLPPWVAPQLPRKCPPKRASYTRGGSSYHGSLRYYPCRRFGVKYHVDYLSTRLRGLGWTAQVPAVWAAERDEELIRAWLDRDWPRIRKRLAARAP